MTELSPNALRVLPDEAMPDDVADAYREAWGLRLKAVTI